MGSLGGGLKALARVGSVLRSEECFKGRYVSGGCELQRVDVAICWGR